MPKNNNKIYIKSAKVHNLKNINLEIPRDRFIVITGLSGSGKSSLAFDTLYAEGQRRYVESLSSYARQFLGRIHKPEVDYIKGIPPAIAIEQKVNTRNPRSTVGTSTELYDYLKLLFARIGKTFSPITNNEVKKHRVTDVINYITSFSGGTKIMILSPFTPIGDRTCRQHMEILLQQGFTRVALNGNIERIDKILESTSESECEKKISEMLSNNKLSIVIDRIVANDSDDLRSRLGDSVEIAFYEGKGECIVRKYEGKEFENIVFSNRFEADGMQFEEPDVNMFSFNNPVGACPKCEGFGKVMGIDEDLVIPNKGLSIYDGAIACWKGEKMKKWNEALIYSADKFDFPIHKPYAELSEKQRELLWTGNQHFEGLNSFFEMLEKENYKIQYRVMLSRYRGKTTCPECKGTRLKKSASYVKVASKSIHELVLMPIWELKVFFIDLKLSENEYNIAKRLMVEINSRLEFLCDVGLGYLTLNRLSASLSGGESQRINLAVSLGSSLVGSLYILDEPSIGLHPRDTERLIKVLRRLQKIGNTVIVVEHDEDIIRASDEIIDIGPLAGTHGGEVVFQGNHDALMKAENSLTTKYLTGEEKIAIPSKRRKWNNYVKICGARENNLKNIDVKFPLNTMTVITGVSGSGKTSLIKTVFYSALNRHYNGYTESSGKFDRIEGDLHLVEGVEFVDQNPIGRSSRSNPVTYIKAYDEIRKLYAKQHAAVINGLTPTHFSFNTEGGRCEECQGEGIIKVEMQFMADVELICESCNGKKFKEIVLDVRYREKNIYDILELTVEEAVAFFKQGKTTLEKKIADKLKPLDDVGLGYVKLGQSSSTLSGGESQRIKLASFLTKEKENRSMLFIFDEPTTGLHFHDIKKLLDAFNALLSRGNSIVIIEHNIEIIKNADWIIDLGPEGGKSGGNIVFEGTPEKLTESETSYTAKYLKEKLLPAK